MGNSAFILNHQVMLRGDPGHGAIGGSRLLYIANRPGVVIEKTEDQLRIEANNERMAKLGYIGFRPGVEIDKELHHGLFDQHGIPDRAAIARELKASDSAIITSVLSVRREDAEAFGLQTRQDWERLLRSQWNKHIELLGVMESQNIRWVAAYHVNQVNNLHVHVFTWDSSGQYDFLIPRKKLVDAHDSFVAEVLRPYQERYNLVRTQSRDELVQKIRECPLSNEMEKQLVSSLPDEGSLKYANLSKRFPEAKESVDKCIYELLKNDSNLSELHQSYMDAV